MPYFQLTLTATTIIQLAAFVDSKFELEYDYTNTKQVVAVAAITLLSVLPVADEMMMAAMPAPTDSYQLISTSVLEHWCLEQ